MKVGTAKRKIHSMHTHRCGDVRWEKKERRLVGAPATAVAASFSVHEPKPNSATMNVVSVPIQFGEPFRLTPRRRQIPRNQLSRREWRVFSCEMKQILDDYRYATGRASQAAAIWVGLLIFLLPVLIFAVFAWDCPILVPIIWFVMFLSICCVHSSQP